MNSPMSATRRGFTLIEVAVVLVSIALLAAIAIPSYNAFMDGTDVRAARAEAELLVKNAAGVSSQDGYIYDCSPVAEADTVSFEVALEQVDAEQGQSPYESPYDQWVDFLGVETPASGVGTIQVIGERWTHYFLVDLCTGELTDTYLDPGDGGPTLQLAIDYPDESFNPLVPGSNLVPTVSGGDGGPLNYSVEGDLPPGVTFDPDTGTFTGLPEWNFRATQISGDGHQQGCAVTTSTTVKCWGYNYKGMLGKGTIHGVNSELQKEGPGDVIAPGESVGGAPLVGVREVAVGGTFVCALLLNGKVTCWGGNYYGELGIGEEGPDIAVPQYVVGVGQSTGGAHLTGVIDIDAGSYHTCAVRTDGTAVCWGMGSNGATGDGLDTWIRPSPGEVLAPGQGAGGGILTNVVQVTAGHMYACARLTDGKAVCWGYNPSGQLGQGGRTTNGDPTAPGYVIGIGESAGGAPLTGVIDIQAEATKTCALLASTRVACWGDNDWDETGILGTGSESSWVLSPELVLNDGGYLENVTALQTDSDGVMCVLMVDTTVQCWGRIPTWGRSTLGRGYEMAADETFFEVILNPERVASPTDSFTVPGTVSGTLSGVTQVTGSRCALTQAGTIYCWGTMDKLVNSIGLEGEEWNYSYETYYPLRITKSGPQPGFPATVTVTATDTSGATDSIQVTLSVS